MKKQRTFKYKKLSFRTKIKETAADWNRKKENPSTCVYINVKE
jgi:hypothetical protein